MFCSIGRKVAWIEAAEIGEMKNIHGVVISFESWFGFLTFNTFVWEQHLVVKLNMWLIFHCIQILNQCLDI